MKLMTTLIAVLFAASSAFADGWLCYQKGYQSGGAEAAPVVAKAFNVTSGPNTRTPGFMILENRAQASDKTIAVFGLEKGTLVSAPGHDFGYVGKVDRRFNETEDGEMIPNEPDGKGARIGNVESVSLMIPNYNFGDKVAHGAQKDGQLIVQKRDGDSFTLDMWCYRYLKGAQQD